MLSVRTCVDVRDFLLRRNYSFVTRFFHGTDGVHDESLYAVRMALVPRLLQCLLHDLLFFSKISARVVACFVLSKGESEAMYIFII